MSASRRARSLLRPCLVTQAVLVLTALGCGLSATPAPTELPGPTFTRPSTLTPAATPTPFHSPTPGLSSQDVESTGQPKGTALFVDPENGYQVAMPENWAFVLISREGQIVVPEDAEDKYPESAFLVHSLGSRDPNAVRLVSIQTQAQYLNADPPTFLVVMVYSDIPASMMAFGMAGLTAWIEDFILDGATILSWETRTNAAGIEIGINDAHYENQLVYGRTMNARIRIISFVAGEKLITIQAFTPPSFAPMLFEQLDGLIDTIELISR